MIIHFFYLLCFYFAIVNKYTLDLINVKKINIKFEGKSLKESTVVMIMLSMICQ